MWCTNVIICVCVRLCLCVCTSRTRRTAGNHKLKKRCITKSIFSFKVCKAIYQLNFFASLWQLICKTEQKQLSTMYTKISTKCFCSRYKIKLWMWFFDFAWRIDHQDTYPSQQHDASPHSGCGKSVDYVVPVV